MEGGREGGHKTSAWQEESSYGFQSMVSSACSALAVAIASHHGHEVREPFTVIPIHQMTEWRLGEVRQLAPRTNSKGPRPQHSAALHSPVQWCDVSVFVTWFIGKYESKSWSSRFDRAWSDAVQNACLLSLEPRYSPR